MWIKFDATTPDKPEVFQIATRLGIDPDAVVGKLLRLWLWADVNTVDGTAKGATRTLVDRITGQPGFSEAVEAVGWLAVGAEGLLIPHWEYHNGVCTKRRLGDAMRKEKSRSHRDKSHGPTVTASSLLSSSLPSLTKGESEGETLPEPLRTDTFRSAWVDWQAHRREIKKPLTPHSMTQQLTQFASWGPERAVEAIRHTILKGWMGIVEPSHGRSNGTVGPPAKATPDHPAVALLVGLFPKHDWTQTLTAQVASDIARIGLDAPRAISAVTAYHRGAKGGWFAYDGLYAALKAAKPSEYHRAGANP